MLEDGSGAAADPTLKLDLGKTMGWDVPSTATQSEESRLDESARTGVFGSFAFKGSCQREESGREPQEKKPAAEFRRLCQVPEKPANGAAPSGKQQRLGSLKRGLLLGVERGSDNWESPASEARKRPRLGLENGPRDSSEEPSSRQAAQQPRRPHIVGLSDDEDEEDDGPAPEPQQPAMRMTVKADKDYGPKMIDLEEVGEILEEDAVDEVLRQCEDISTRLKKALGSGAEGDGLSALEGSAGMASPEVLASACGPAARYIKSYQLIGINFLLLLAREGVEGSILADEMGLGKTAQTICFLGCLKQMFGDEGPHLVICPASLLENWQRELARWCPSLKVVLYYGANRSDLRHELKATRNATSEVLTLDSDSDPEEQSASESEPESGYEDGDGRVGQTAEGSASAPFNVMLTSYTLFERDSVEQRLDRNFMKSWAWSHVVLDEAHAVKNSTAARTVRLNRLAEQCRRRIMLTGTPLQNDLSELQNLLRFLMPKLFTAEQAAELQNVTDEEEMARLAERMQGLLRPFVLRRLKTEVATQLQPKRQKLVRVAMLPGQAQLYSAAVDELRSSLVPSTEKGKEEADAAKVAKAVKKLGQRKVGNSFVELRKLALHPLLARRIFGDSRVAAMAKMARRRGLFGQASEDKICKELLGYSDFQLHSFALENGSAFKDYLLGEEQLYASAKCRYLAKLLPELKAAGSRPLIFSQWVVMLDILEWLLQTLRLPYVRLDGSTAVAERLTLVDMFNNKENGVFAFLLTTRAGGQGLNLTGADTVLLHDVDFNPQVDRQAEDRCHRLGQTRPVTVYRLVTQGTVDESIQALAEKKLRLDAAVLDGITASAQRTKAFENAAMSELLQSLLTGGPSDTPPGEGGNPIEVVTTPDASSDGKDGDSKAGKVVSESPSGGAEMETVTVVLDTPTSSAKQGSIE